MNAVQSLRSPDARPVLLPEQMAELDRLIVREIERMTRSSDRPTDEPERAVDPIDIAAALTLRETEAVTQDRFANGIIVWMQALRRLRDSPASFGVCTGCKEPIPFERLEILPATRTCRDCG